MGKRKNKTKEVYRVWVVNLRESLSLVRRGQQKCRCLEVKV